MSEAIRTKPLPATRTGSAAASVTPAPEASRISLRAGEEALAALSSALDLGLPTQPKTSESKNGRMALWLGPDEWLIIDQNGADLMALCATVSAPHSATDVSHRNTAIIISGPGAADAINGGCPLDLSLKSFPVGACTRTLLAKIEIVLYRSSEDTFRVECWRSFAPYALGMLAEGAMDASA
ncbi:sarcosine oxidase subunit gamma [Rhizobium sp. L1K21]|uniref:sarcosine oxidase subunit gamma n=1 Tax=Rhizobium sp. L1K21 TaxID=2954933 RepID=UPI002093359C|nr:sarcosine oxidase subunit gamma [Rhizobium sp. L1K21]MCO6184988.1 sarcosine oxidase subunit gamma [Rhizobium sp. L1K21]